MDNSLSEQRGPEIPLLSRKPLCDFTPEDFKLYVRSMKTERKAAKKGAKPQGPKVTWSLSPKKGTLTIKVRRTPKWMKHSEFDSVVRESGREATEVFAATKRLGILIHSDRLSAEIEKRMAEIPF